MTASWLEELNTAQRDAVTHGDGPLLIVAGAGTGKTKTLACRVAWLIQNGVPAERILLLTFTRRAAAEMIGRAGRICGEATSARVWGGTFHAVANRLLRMHGRSLGLGPDFTVMDQGDAADMMNLIRNELGHSKGNRRFPKKETLMSIYSRTVNAQEKLREVLQTHFPWCAEEFEGIAAIFGQYTSRKPEQNVLDYDDLLLYWSALCEVPGVGERLSDQFDHILVDEYQDTNAIQSRILRGMRTRRKNICVVGDDAQSIYSFRAATVRNILDFPNEFPGTRVVTLEQNYRSIPPILAASNAVMEQARERFTKDLWSERRGDQRPVLVTCMDESQQSDAVCANLLTHLERGVPLMKQAVLFRASHHSAHLEIELTRRNIPFHKFGGLKFIEAAHIKDVLAFLRILENPFDEISWFRVLQLIEGVGPRSAQRIMDDLAVRRPAGETRTAQTQVSPLSRILRNPPAFPAAARKQLDELRQALSDCLGTTLGGEPPVLSGSAADAAAESDQATTQDQADAHPDSKLIEPPLVSQIERIRRFYQPIFEARYDSAAMRTRDLEQLESVASGYRSRSRFITDLTLDPPAATSDLAQPPHLDEDWLTLSTIHSAKGCEWHVVHILHAADGMIPSDMAVADEAGVDEERRLFYVAMTRARDNLYVYFPLRYYHRRFSLGDGHGYAQLTRFISNPVRTVFEERMADGSVPGQADQASQTTAAGGAERIRARLNDLFQG